MVTPQVYAEMPLLRGSACLNAVHREFSRTKFVPESGGYTSDESRKFRMNMLRMNIQMQPSKQ